MGDQNNPFRTSLVPEWHRHVACLMAWPWQDCIWDTYLDEVRGDISELAIAISKFEPVILLVPLDQRYRPREDQFPGGADVHLVPFEYDDIWVRDTGPIWLSDGRAITPRFNGWGNKSVPGRRNTKIPHERDAQLASRICQAWGIDMVDLGLVLEGGAIEADAHGTIMLTESNFFHPQRNGRLRPLSPSGQAVSVQHESPESMLQSRISKRVIRLPGCSPASSKYDLTDGHIDSIARFSPSGVILVDALQECDHHNPERGDIAANLDAIEKSWDMDKVIRVLRPCHKATFHANSNETYSYLNYYVCNGGVIYPSFVMGGRQFLESRHEAIRADLAAGKALSSAFAESIGLAAAREVQRLALPSLIKAGGGGIHCVTREIPATVSPNVMTLVEKLLTASPTGRVECNPEVRIVQMPPRGEAQ